MGVVVIASPNFDGIVATALLKKITKDKFSWFVGTSSLKLFPDDVTGNDVWLIGSVVNHDLFRMIKNNAGRVIPLNKCSKSGPSLSKEVYSEFVGKFPELLPYNKLVSLVDGWERGVRGPDGFDARPIQWSALMFTLGFERFIDRLMSNPNPDFTDTEKLILDIEEERKSRLFDQVAKRKYVMRWLVAGREYVTAVVFANTCVSETAHYLLRNDENIQMVLVINLVTNTVAVRARDKSINLRDMVTRFQGGGYDRAAGFPVPSDLVWKFITELTA